MFSAYIFDCGKLPQGRFEARLSSHAIQNDSVEHQSHLEGFDLVSNDRRKLKSAFFESLIPDRETIAIPVQDFNSRRILVPENEEMSGKRILPQYVFDKHHEPIEGAAHVRVLPAKK